MALDENYKNEFNKLLKSREELLNEYEVAYNEWEVAKTHKDSEKVLKHLIELKVDLLKIATINAKILFLGFDPYSDVYYKLTIEDAEACERNLKVLQKSPKILDEDLSEIFNLEKKLNYCGVFKGEAAKNQELPELVRLSLQYAKIDFELCSKKAILFREELF